MVYIAEAHARDQWPVGSQVSFCDAPTSLEARVALARQLYAAQPDLAHLPCLVDGMADSFLEAFAAWPLRLFVLHRGKLAFKAAPKDGEYDLADLEAWLTANTAA